MTEITPQDELDNEPTDKIVGSAFDKGAEEKPEDKAAAAAEAEKKSRTSYRVEKLNKKYREIERELQIERERRIALEEQTKLKAEPDENNYSDFEAFKSDKAKWEKQKESEIEERVTRKIKEKEFKAKQDKIEGERAAKYAQQRAKEAKSNEDFQEHESLVSSAVNFYGAWDMRDAIMESDKGAQIITHLGNHPDELEKIAGLDRVSQIARIIEIQNKLDAKPVKKVSSAPDPVRSGSKSAIAPANPSNETTAEYIRRVNFGN